MERDRTSLIRTRCCFARSEAHGTELIIPVTSELLELRSTILPASSEVGDEQSRVLVTSWSGKYATILMFDGVRRKT
jgi:hypothetical protein